MWNIIKTNEMSIGQILNMTMNIFKQNFKAILIASLIIFVPINIAISLMPIGQALDEIAIALNQLNVDSAPETFVLLSSAMMNYVKWNLLSVILTQIFGCLATMAVAFIAYQFIDGNKLDYKLSLEQAFSKWLPAIWTVILSSLIMICLYFFMIIPALIFAIYANFMIYAVIIENQKGLGAIKYSFNLVKGRFWKTVGKLITIFIIQYVVIYIIATIFSFMGANIIVIFLSNCINTIVNSFFCVFQAIWFLNYMSVKSKL